MSAKETDIARRAYQTALKSEPGKIILQDLAKFCGSMKSSFSRDPLEMAHREGRREVWLRIQSFLNLTEEDIFQLFELEKQDE